MFIFTSPEPGIVIASNNIKKLATYTANGDAWECKLAPRHGCNPKQLEAMDAAFQEYLEIPQQSDASDQPDPSEETPAPPLPMSPSLPSLPAPAPDPVSGTTSIPYMLHIAQHGTDEKFTELYAERLKNKPSFLPWIQRTEELRPFLSRAQKLNLA